ncbi:MAG: iron-sulfur cluster assembly protein [Micavibrio sp.]
MTKFEHVADEEMVKNAVGDGFDEMAEPPDVALADHPAARAAADALRKVYDPEIPVNIYELGLIYSIDVVETGDADGKVDINVIMSLTSPACPVAQEMPVWVQGAIFALEGVRHVDVEVTFDPPWDPSKMAETAKLQLNMFV